LRRSTGEVYHFVLNVTRAVLSPIWTAVKNFIFAFSTDVSNAEGQVVQGEYQISKRWSVNASRDQYGGFAVNGKFHKSF